MSSADAPDRRLLLVHAHPDDESIYTGATMAKYAAEGARVTLVTCTLAELGVTDHRFLGGPGRWRDSGMMGTEGNDDPRCFWRADVDQAAGALLDVIAEARPQVLLTYDAQGAYGHPDHIQAHRVAWRACELAGPDAPEKFYATATLESGLVTTEVQASAWFGAKLAAMRAHATQITVDPPFFALSDGVRRPASGTEYYTLLAGPRGPGLREAGLFAR
jgi:N-acetyl-1-D-myo-inositol-2-amino-2-deoxy-alpha-D-glucopyranoside deacetylase